MTKLHLIAIFEKYQIETKFTNGKYITSVMERKTKHVLSSFEHFFPENAEKFHQMVCNEAKEC